MQLPLWSEAPPDADLGSRIDSPRAPPASRTPPLFSGRNQKSAPPLPLPLGLGRIDPLHGPSLSLPRADGRPPLQAAAPVACCLLRGLWVPAQVGLVTSPRPPARGAGCRVIRPPWARGTVGGAAPQEMSGRPFVRVAVAFGLWSGCALQGGKGKKTPLPSCQGPSGAGAATPATSVFLSEKWGARSRASRSGCASGQDQTCPSRGGTDQIGPGL